MSGQTTSRAEDPLRVRERAEREARFVARAIPDSGRIVGLVYGESGAARSAEAAAGIASAVGVRREHTLLAATETGEGSLDDAIGGREGPGLWGVLAGRARLTDVAVRSERRPYTYLPAGAAPPAPPRLLGAARLRRFVHRAREQGGTLLVHMPQEGLAEAAALLDGFVRLGALEVAVPPGLQEFGRVVFAEEEDGVASPQETIAAVAEPAAEAGRPATEAGRPATEAGRPATEAGRPATEAREAASRAQPTDRGERSTGRWSRHRSSAGFPVVRAALGALVILVLGVGWWAISRESIAGASDASEAVEAPGGQAEPTPPAAAEAATAEGGTPPPPTETTLLARLEAMPALPYAVLIASYARGSDAVERVRDLAEEGSGLFYVAPTPVRGRLYHRVFAGALADAPEARRRMEALVAGGRKDAASDWDVRPVRLAYRLGVYASRVEAESRIREAIAAGVPAYLLTAAASADSTAAAGSVDSAYAAWAGGYESESAARGMSVLLERAGLEAELVERRGSPRP